MLFFLSPSSFFCQCIYFLISFALVQALNVGGKLSKVLLKLEEFSLDYQDNDDFLVRYFLLCPYHQSTMLISLIPLPSSFFSFLLFPINSTVHSPRSSSILYFLQALLWPSYTPGHIPRFHHSCSVKAQHQFSVYFLKHKFDAIDHRLMIQKFLIYFELIYVV